jgi:hypothetical protein
VPIEFITQIVIRPITLSVRLWANFLAGHFLLAVFFLGTVAMLQGGWIAIFAPFSFAIGVVLVAFEVFVSLLQAFIFTILTASYIGGCVGRRALTRRQHVADFAQAGRSRRRRPLRRSGAVVIAGGAIGPGIGPAC